jgi:hypothetical protein
MARMTRLPGTAATRPSCCPARTARRSRAASAGSPRWTASASGTIALQGGGDYYAQFALTSQDSASGIVDECGPKSPDSHRVVWGLTSRPPGSPTGLPPASGLPAGFIPFARRPLVSLRPAFSGSFPSAVARCRSPPVSLRVPVHLSSFHGSAAAGRFRRRLVPGGKDQGHQYCRDPARLDRTRSARTPDGQRLATMGCRARIACYKRPRALDIAAPEPLCRLCIHSSCTCTQTPGLPATVNK